MDPQFETVHTVDDYYDGPRSGSADLGGSPHFYHSLYLDNETWDPDGNRFELSPASPEVRDLAVDAFLLWQWWQLASFAGTAPDIGPDGRAYSQKTARGMRARIHACVPLADRPGAPNRDARRVRWPIAPGRPLSALTVRWTPI